MLSAKQVAGFFKMQYLQKQGNDEVYFLHAGKHQIFLQVDTIKFSLCKQAYRMYAK